MAIQGIFLGRSCSCLLGQFLARQPTSEVCGGVVRVDAERLGGVLVGLGVIHETVLEQGHLRQRRQVVRILLQAGLKRDFGTNGFVVTFGVPLPLFNRNEGGVARAGAEERQAAAQLTAAETRVTLEVQEALNSVDVSRRRLDYVEGEYLKNAREARDIVLASYRSGATTLIDYMDAQRALREALRTQNRARFEYRISLFQYEAAVGTPSVTVRKELP
jgi:hypothetical protein